MRRLAEPAQVALVARGNQSHSTCERCGATCPHPRRFSRLNPNLCLRCVLAIPPGEAITQENEWVLGALARLRDWDLRGGQPAERKAQR